MRCYVLLYSVPKFHANMSHFDSLRVPQKPDRWKEFDMSARIYPDVNTSSASNGATNRPVHRMGDDVDTIDQLPSPYLLGIAVAGSAVACLLIRLVIG
jgi:hypothetical protein